jgi:hypothetical protein
MPRAAPVTIAARSFAMLSFMSLAAQSRLIPRR